MASRHLKRLQQQKQEILEQQDDEDEETTPSASAERNLFQLLGEKTQEDEPGAEEQESTNGREEEVLASPVLTGSIGSSGKAAKKRQKKRAKGVKQTAPQLAQEDNEDLDKLLEAMNIKLEKPQESSQGGANTVAHPPLDVLATSPRKLKPEAELRKIFGTKVVSSEAREQNGDHQHAGASRRVRRLLARGVLQKVPLKSGLLIRPRDHWPKPDGSLTLQMEGKCATTCDVYFRYVHSAAYKVAQRLFEQAQASYNPNEVLELLHHYPYHVDALLAAADLYRATGQHDTAEDMLSRCLYVLEMAWPPQFIECGKLRIDVEENLPLFKALFRHIQTLIKRGLYITALENAKLLLALNEADPSGVLLCIDYIAIKAGQYEYLEDFVIVLDPSGSKFAFLPNWVFSLALAKFLRSKQPDQSAQNGKGAELSDGAKAVMQYPAVVLAILEKLEDQGIHKDAEFQQLLKQRLFRDADEQRNASLSHVTAIYAERQSSLYKAPGMMDWLKQCCKEATAPHASSHQQNWARLREELWPPSEVNEYAHLRLSSFSDSIAALPPEEVQAMMARPAPGAHHGAVEEIVLDLANLPAGNGQDAPPEVREQLQELANQEDVRNLAQRIRAGGEVSDEDLQQLHPLVAILQTLLPWVNYGVNPADAEEPPRDDGAQ